MIVSRHRLPSIVVMAVAALVAEAGGMRVVGAVAAVAVLRDLVLVVAAAVAGEAVDLGVHAEQLVAGLLEVIELRGLPLLGDVALGAVGAARAAVLIVRGVAADAGLRRLPCSGRRRGRHCRSRSQVRAGQLEVRLVMIELAAAPALRAVALAAGLGELPAVHVVGFVAADAGRGRLAPGLALLVAAVAVERGWAPSSAKSVGGMIELRAIELHDVGIAALVFRVAGAALADAGVGHAAVIAAGARARRPRCPCDSPGTARIGLRDVGAVVAVGAGLLLLHVRARDLARHQQRLHRGRERARDCEQPTVPSSTTIPMSSYDNVPSVHA